MAAYIWGFGKLGQIGSGHTDTVHTPIKLAVRDKVTDLHCGGYYTAVISDKGELWTCGCGKYGRLGTGEEDNKLKPVPVTPAGGQDVKFVKVSCGIWHGSAVSSDGDVYVWGYNKSHGVLGSTDIPHMSLPTLLPGLFSKKVAGVTCGNNFTLLWTQDGESYSWGCGRHGVLGHGTDSDVHTPSRIHGFDDNVVFMNAGFAHCGAITSSGNVYMFGKGSDGALGLGKKKLDQLMTPCVVERLSSKNIIQLSCSVGEKHGHTLFVSACGQVYSVGDGYKGKLGLGDQESRYEPTAISPESFNGENIALVAAGGIHSAAVSKEGHVFTWGCGSDGRLGHPDGKGHRYLFRSDVPRVVDGLVKQGRAVRLVCSYYHTAALLVDNQQ